MEAEALGGEPWEMMLEEAEPGYEEPWAPGQGVYTFPVGSLLMVLMAVKVVMEGYFGQGDFRKNFSGCGIKASLKVKLCNSDWDLNPHARTRTWPKPDWDLNPWSFFFFFNLFIYSFI